MAKALRPGKVFIDWSQNNAAKTTVAPYSLRAGELRPSPRRSTGLSSLDNGQPPRFWTGSPGSATCMHHCWGKRVKELLT